MSSMRNGVIGRLAVHVYEMQPHWRMIGLPVFTLYAVWITTLVTIGFSGFIGRVGNDTWSEYDLNKNHMARPRSSSGKTKSV